MSVSTIATLKTTAYPCVRHISTLGLSFSFKNQLLDAAYRRAPEVWRLTTYLVPGRDYHPYHDRRTRLRVLLNVRLQYLRVQCHVRSLVIGSSSRNVRALICYYTDRSSKTPLSAPTTQIPLSTYCPSFAKVLTQLSVLH